jgi:predicted O-methyltransferase YrrM
MELYSEPLNILSEFENNGYSGMSDNDLGFLCGAIEKFKPSKIVEVGVSAGGTTAVIMECCKRINLSASIYSVDVSKKWYKDVSKETGFVATEYIEKGLLSSEVSHKFVLGKTLAKAIEEIGNEIDFIIFDTMHSLPGELLDFISSLNWLKKNAVIVFHDMGQCQLGIRSVHGAPFQYASLVTFLAIKGKHYWNQDKNNIYDVSNIGCVQIDSDVDKMLDNIFSGLFVNWDYIPDEKSLEEYCYRIKRDYTDEYVNLFEKALGVNVYSLYRRRGIHVPRKRIQREIDDIIDKKDHIYVYGAGSISKKVCAYINYKSKKVRNLIVTQKNVGGEEISIEELKVEADAVIILGLDEKYHWDVLQTCKKYGYEDMVWPSHGIGFREFLSYIEDELEDNEMINKCGYESQIISASKQ